ncbi:MAG TPA: acetoin utilization protein AcuC [Deinococcales bacterium]|nr:acetoin utilization protein AcuC [Deinococcales bacterium]
MTASAEHCLFVYSPDYQEYRLRRGHPFDPVRVEASRSLIEACGLLPPELVVPAEAAGDEDLLSVHSEVYLRVVKEASRGAAERDLAHYGLGTPDTPAFPGMHEAAAAVVGGTLTAARLVVEGTTRRALNLGGGLHHAHRAKAAGFCVYNDLSVAIAELRSRGLRVAYLDVDAHHGDGVQWLHYDDPDVLTISLHETGRYLFPGTGFTFELGRGDGLGSSLNVPLEPYTEDRSLLEALERVVAPALAWHRPDVLVLQAGADAHFLDPLADLALTTQGLHAAFRLAVQLAEAHCGGRVVATGGGGYATWQAVPRAWTGLYAALAGTTLPDEVPEEWIARWEAIAGEELPHSFADEPPAVPRRDQVEARNRQVVDRLLLEWRSVTGQES